MKGNGNVFLKQFSRLWIYIICLNLVLPATQHTSDQQKTDAQVYVDVINVELVLRALKKGVPVPGLQQKDFTLYENGKPSPLTSFVEVHRKVGHAMDDTHKKPEVEKGVPTKKRLFFLYFRVSQPDPQIQETLNYFFNKVFRDSDYAILMFNGRIFPITRLDHVQPVITAFNRELALFARDRDIARQQLTDNLNRMLKNFENEFKKNRELPQLRVALGTQMVGMFKNLWQQYQQGNAVLEEEKLKALAASLKKVELEKWGLVFYQQESIPQVNLQTLSGRTDAAQALLRNIRNDIDKIIRDMQGTPHTMKAIQQFKQSFTEANATFHIFFSNPTSMGKMETAYIRQKTINSNWQQVFGDISKNTGGTVISDNKIKESLTQAVDREDVFYRLTFAPRSSGKEQRKIRIRTKLKGLKLHYHRKIKVEKVETIKLAGFSYKHPQVEFTLKDYRQLFNGNHLFGDIRVKVTYIDAKGKLKDLERILEPEDQEMAVSMKVNFPTGGEYTLIIEVTDRQTGKSAVFSEKIAVPKSKYELEDVLVGENMEEMTGTDNERILAYLLKKSAAYCKKLKKATFYFVCTEEVIDLHWLRGVNLREQHHLYDYQIIKEDSGKMKETRKWKASPPKPEKKKKRKKKKKKKKKQKVESSPTSQQPTKPPKTIRTNFNSSYPYLMPIGMLAKEYQSKYRYRLAGKKNIKGSTYYVICVEPKEKGVRLKDTNYGVVWVDESDGSVYRVKLDPNSLGGLSQLKRIARQRHHRLKFNDVHWYKVKRQGLRFPSKTEIDCAFLDWDEVSRGHKTLITNALEKVATVFEYKTYKFFNVKSDVVGSGHE